MRAGKERAREECEQCRDCEECRDACSAATAAAALALGRVAAGVSRCEPGERERTDGNYKLERKRQRRGQRVWHGGTTGADIAGQSHSPGYKYTTQPEAQTPSGTAVGEVSLHQQPRLLLCEPLHSTTFATRPSITAIATKHRSRSLRWPLLLLSLLAWFPLLCAAVPAPTRTTFHPRRTLATEAPAPPPSGVLPTSITPVKATTLPIRLKYDKDSGHWEPVEGWVYYGRGFDQGSPDVFVNDSFATDPPDWAIWEVLPRGWGQTSDRSSLYRTPLIAISSIILAALIVTGLLVLFISQRRTHRRALRRRTKDRVKALRAAGIQIDTNDHRAVDALYHEKIEAKPAKTESRKTALTTAKKVGKWRRGLRRRKLGASEAGSAEQVVIVEEDEPRRSVSNSIGGSRDGENPRVQATDDGQASQANPPGDRSSEEQGVTALTDQTTGTSEISPGGSGSASGSGTRSDGEATAPPSGNPPQFFPPAYRPASMYDSERPRGSNSEDSPSGSGNNTPPPPHPASSSSAAGSSAPHHLSARAQEKSPASYYPAPTTLEAEQALAVAQAAESGQASGSVRDGDEEETATAHVATDDKQLLERLRVRSSRPPTATRSEDVVGLASAPTVNVDEDGFERYELDVDASGSSDPVELGPVVDDETNPSAIPLPPRPTVQRSLQAFSAASPSALQHSEPSAPPMSVDAISPSAPALDAEEDDGVAPSAPPPDAAEDNGDDDDDDDDDELEYSSPPPRQRTELELVPAPETETDSAEELAAHQARVGAAPETGATVTFLPKYEP